MLWDVYCLFIAETFAFAFSLSCSELKSKKLSEEDGETSYNSNWSSFNLSPFLQNTWDPPNNPRAEKSGFRSSSNQFFIIAKQNTFWEGFKGFQFNKT